MAERVWSDPEEPWQEAEQRILQHRHRLVRRGIRADAIQPEFCRQHAGWCYMPQTPEFDFNAAMGFDNGNNEIPVERKLPADSLLKEMEERPNGLRPDTDEESDSDARESEGRSQSRDVNDGPAVSVWVMGMLALGVALAWVKRWALLGTFLQCWKRGREKVFDHVA